MKVVLLKQFTFLLFTALTLGLFASEDFAEEKLNQANELYEKGEYSEASKAYKSLLADGYFSADVHYNLGNSYYQLNQIAPAILHYEKALKLNPSHEDAAFNLILANEKTIDKIEAIPELFIYRWWKSIYNLFGMDTWAKWVVVFFFIALMGLLIYWIGSKLSLRKIGFYTFLTAFVLALFSWLMADRQKSKLNRIDYAIIMEPTVNINSSPSAGSSKLFVLHEGTKVKVEEVDEDWMNVSLPNGNKGWVKMEKLEVI